MEVRKGCGQWGGVAMTGVSRRAFLGGAASTGAGAFVGASGAVGWIDALVQPTAASGLALAQLPPSDLKVRLFARKAVLDRFTSLPSITRAEVETSWPVGMMPAWTDVTSTADGGGTVFVGVVPSSGTIAGNGFRQSVAMYDLATSQLRFIDFPTTTPLPSGEPRYKVPTAYYVSNPWPGKYQDHPYIGGADISDVCVLPAQDGLPETVILNSVTPYGTWRITPRDSPNPTQSDGKGVFRSFVVLTKEPQGWAFSTRSRTADQLWAAYGALRPEPELKHMFPLLTSRGTDGSTASDQMTGNWPGP